MFLSFCIPVFISQQAFLLVDPTWTCTNIGSRFYVPLKHCKLLDSGQADIKYSLLRDMRELTCIKLVARLTSHQQCPLIAALWSSLTPCRFWCSPSWQWLLEEICENCGCEALGMNPPSENRVDYFMDGSPRLTTKWPFSSKTTRLSEVNYVKIACGVD